MMGFLTRIFPAGLWMRLMSYALAFTVGLAAGNGWATQRALERELQNSADRQRKNHQELISWYAGKMKELRLAREQQEGADAAAYAILSKGKDDAAKEAERARASLRGALSQNQKLMETNDGLKNVNAMLAAEARVPDPGCIMPPGVRQSVNAYIAQLNAAPAVGAARDPATGLPLEPPGPSAFLTCQQLADSVIDILQTAGSYIARDASWREWAEKIR